MNRIRLPAIFFSLLLCCLLVFQVQPAGVGNAAATTWYVATTGNDLTGSGSSGNPWQTIEYAVSSPSVQAGDTVNVAAGSYIQTTQLNLNKANLTLAGAGRSSTFVQVSGTGYGFYITAAGVTVNGFGIQKTDKTGVQNIIYLGNNNISVTNNEISGQFVIGDAEVSRAMESTAGLSGLNISNNTIHNLRQPAYINGVTTGTIANNYVYLTRGWVLAQGNMIFTNNTWGTGANANVYDIAILSGVSPTYYADIPAMAAANNGAFIEDQRTSPYTLSIVYVDGSVAASGDGTARSPEKTISEGVTRAVTSGTINVVAGTYVEKVIVNKTLTLKGANVGISAGATPGTRGPESIIQGGVQIQGNNVIIDGFKIDGPGPFGGQYDGIYIVGGTTGLTIANNVLAGHGRSQATDGWAMDFGYYTSAVAVRNNYIGNWWSTYINPTNPGSSLLFEGNHFYNNYVGIGSDGLNDVNIQYNKFTGNTLEGFGTSNVGSNVRAHYNDFVGNATGINHYGGGQTVDATNNWWGDASGPHNAASNPTGLGDAVSSNVLFNPWTGMVVPTVAPALLTPANGATVSGNSVTFTWNPVSGATKYLLIVNTASANKIYLDVGNVTTYTNTTFAGAGTVYYWAVWAGNSAGWCADSLAYANTRSFTNTGGGGAPTVAPTLVSPANGAMVNGTSVTFTWNPVSGATKYLLIVNTASANKIYLDVGNVATYTNTTFAGDGTVYYWAVWAGNTAGWCADSLAYANTCSFTNTGSGGGGVPTAAPALVSPANGSTVSGTSVTFTWNAVSGATKYRLVVSTAGNLGSKINLDVGNVTTWTDSTFAGAGTVVYYWDVWSGNSAGWCADSLVFAKERAFINSGVPTAAPALVSPANGAGVSGNSVTFTWNPISGATKYLLVVSTTSANKICLDVGNVTTWTDSTFGGASTAYWWAVWSGNSAGWCADSLAYANTRYFIYGGTPTTAPTPVSPLSWSTVSGNSVTFTWNAVSGATKYRLMVSTAHNPGSKMFLDVGNVTTWTDNTFEGAGTIYYWDVWAGNEAGWCADSLVWANEQLFLNTP